MLTPPFTFRNLTSTQINLRHIGRYDAPKEPSGGNGFSTLTKNITTVLANTTNIGSGNNGRPKRPALQPDASPFESKDLEYHFPPFKTVATDVSSYVKSPQEYVRLIFGIEGQRYSLVLPTPSYQSMKLKPLDSHPKFDVTVVYLAKHAYMTFFSSAHLDSWMKELKDETPLSALSIPGTHNTPTCHVAAPSVRCQARSPKTQLENGVRFFDIRVQIQDPGDRKKDGLVLVHSVFPISLTGNKYFRDLVKETFAFLEKHPSETVIMSLKREGTGNGTDEQLGRILRDHYAGDVHHWFTAPRVPKLGECRKKIVLLRRFKLEDGLKNEWDGAGWCIDGHIWADNTPHAMTPDGVICVQDFYELLETQNIEKKIQYAQAQCERSASCTCLLEGQGTVQTSHQHKIPLYINFLSGSNFWNVGCWPEKIAKKVNPAMVDYLCRNHAQGDREGDGSTGILVCDWVGQDGDWDLVRCIVGMNAILEAREKSASA